MNLTMRNTLPTALVLLLWFTSVSAQTDNTFSYSVSINGEVERSVTQETEGAVTGAFYIAYNQPNRPLDSWQLVFGIRGGEDFLLEKLRIALPSPKDEPSLHNSPAVYFLSTLVTEDRQTFHVWFEVEPKVEPKLELTRFDDDRAEGSFAFSFKGTTCVRGMFSLDLNEDASDLHLLVQDGDSESDIRERAAFNKMDAKSKNLVEREKLQWNTYEYLLVPGLTTIESTEKSVPVNACENR